MATYFAFDFISDLAFGNTLEMMVKEEPRYIRNVLMHASQFLNYLGYLPFVALVRPFLGTSVQDYIGGQSAADSLKFTRLANDRMAERIEAGEQAKRSGKEMRKDIFHHLLIARDAETGLGLTIEELQADAFLLIAAGSDTIAMTISACIFYLMRHPSAYANLQAEIRSAFSSPDEIRSPKLHNLPYLMASIQETLRLNPPAPSHFQRLVQPGGLMISNPPIDGSDDVDNKNNGTSTSSTLPETILIPAGTNVGVPPYAIHHNETYYPDSWSFRPERWIVSPETGTSPASLALARRAYCPFSTGSMDCVAKNMAYLTIKLALANMLWAFDIRLAPKVVGEGSADVQFYTGLRDATGAGDPEASDEGRKRIGEYQMVDFAAGYRDGPMIELRERGSSS